MKNFLKTSFAVGVAVAAMSVHAKAQTVQANVIGSSAFFLQAGQGANINGATCVWSTKSDNPGGVNDTVQATDTSIAPPKGPAVDKGSAWVAWTPAGGTCATPGSGSAIYAYLQTDSVVGNRCLFNGANCTIKYPTGNPASENLILASGEVPLATAVANLLNGGAAGTGTSPNAAATDIRPEDAEFATARALTACGTPVVTGSQYLGLGYANGDKIISDFPNPPASTNSTFNVVSFTLPANYTVTPVGATPLVVVVNGPAFGSTTNLSNSDLAKFLDGSTTLVPNSTVIIREPLSGTYNTMEYNIPNATGNTNTKAIGPVASANKTSQDVGQLQPTAQRNCPVSSSTHNPMHITDVNGGLRRRAIGTGQELSSVLATTNSLGYGFWSVANFTGFAGSTTAKYLKIDGVDPLGFAGQTFPALTSFNNVNLATTVTTTANQNYPIWTLLRLVNAGTSALPGVSFLQSGAQKAVLPTTPGFHVDFISTSSTSLKVVRSHFVPPIGAGEPTTAANGHVGGGAPTTCNAPEKGGDVGGIVLSLTADAVTCAGQTVKTGTNGERR